jgi:thiamine pyrophosphate-dependent acetolactate synthase large subunit-like protein
MGKTVSDQVIEILVEAGVERCYGVPGDATDLMLASIHQRKDIDFILTRHEEAAGFMANGHAKLNGELGVVLAAQGPGAAHMLNCMYDAKMDKVPLLVITGQIESHVIGTNTVQEINQLLLFEDVAEFNREVRSANNVVAVLQLAIQTALVKRCVAHVSIATDILRHSPEKRIKSPAIYDMPFKLMPEQRLIAKAAAILNDKKNIAILYGGGCIHAKEELMQAAELLNAPIVHTVRSKDIIDNHNPHYAGGIGFKGSRNGCKTVADCDALLIIGCSFAWSDFYPQDVPIIQIDINPQRIGVRCPVEVGLIGDAKLTMIEINNLLTKKDNDDYLQKSQSRHAAAIKKLDQKAELKAKKPVSSPLLTSIISQHMAEDAILTVDAGTVSVWANNWLRLNGKQRLIGSTELGTLGFAMPAAIGCQLAEPNKQVIVLCGDGGFQMTMGDFSTAVKYNLPIKIFVYNNFAYHFIELEQMREGVEQCYTKLNNPDYALLGKAFGGEGFSIKQPSEVESVVKAALACDKPCIVDVHIQTDELIMPTKITLEMIASFIKGEIKTKLSHSNS